MTFETTVSVIVAAHNAEATIDYALKSVASQTFAHWECIIVDDCSTDRTRDLIQMWSQKDGRFKLLHTPSNLGPSGARNLAISVAAGEWITVLDADDRFDPLRLINLLAAAEKLRAQVIIDNQFHWRASNNLHTTWLTLDASKLLTLTLTQFLYQVSGASRVHWGAAKPMFHRTLIAQHSPLFDVNFHRGEDVLFLAQLIQRAGSLGVCGAIGYVYRLPEGDLRHMSLADNSDAWRVSKKMIDDLSMSVGWWGRLWLRFRVLHFALDGWRSQIARARRARRYIDVAQLVLSEPRSWLWLSVRATRWLRP